MSGADYRRGLQDAHCLLHRQHQWVIGELRNSKAYFGIFPTRRQRELAAVSRALADLSTAITDKAMPSGELNSCQGKTLPALNSKIGTER